MPRLGAENGKTWSRRFKDWAERKWLAALEERGYLYPFERGNRAH
jgi:hypothetical protein